MISNHFKLKIKNSGLVHLYSIDFGTLTDTDYEREAMRSCYDALKMILGNFIYCSKHVFAL